MIFAKSSSRTIALRQDHKIERLAIASKRNRQKRDRERENHVASIPILYSPCSLSLAYMALQRRRRIFHEKKRFSRSPFVIYSYALITRFTPNPPPGHQLGWNGRSRKRAGMVGNRQSAAVISGWTKARGWNYEPGEGRVRDKHTDSPDSSCSISASESSPPPTWRLDISGEREERE